MKVTREMLGKAHDILLKKGLMLSGSMLEEIYEAMEFQRQKDGYFDGDVQDVLLAKIATLEKNLFQMQSAAIDLTEQIAFQNREHIEMQKYTLELEKQIVALKDELASALEDLDREVRIGNDYIKQITKLEKLSAAISRDCNNTALERNTALDQIAKLEAQLKAAPSQELCGFVSGGVKELGDFRPLNYTTPPHHAPLRLRS